DCVWLLASPLTNPQAIESDLGSRIAELRARRLATARRRTDPILTRHVPSSDLICERSGRHQPIWRSPGCITCAGTIRFGHWPVVGLSQLNPFETAPPNAPVLGRFCRRHSVLGNPSLCCG